MDPRFSELCAAVCAQVRFSADHPAIRRELTAHLEDHAGALMDRGAGPDEAASAAVAAMGDPEELGRALDRLHSPWLGVLQQLVLAAGCILVALSLVFCYANRYQLGQRYFRASDFDREMEMFGDRKVFSRMTCTLYPGGEAVQAGDYTLRITRSLMLREEGGSTLLFELSARCLDPRLGVPGFPGALTAVDSLGNEYVNRRDTEERPSGVDIYDDYYESYTTTPFSARLEGRIRQVAEGAEWVDLHYEGGGTRFTLRIPLTGGEPYET